MIIVYTTVPDEMTAKKIAKTLLDTKLIACANYYPITSLYNWNDKLCNDSEYTLLLKTAADKFEILKDELSILHPYEIPCILKLHAEPSFLFGNWINEQLT